MLKYSNNFIEKEKVFTPLLKETNEYLSSYSRQSERGNSRRFEMFLEIQQFAQNMKKQI